MTDTNPQPARTPYCHKIRYGITGAPILDEAEMDGSFAPGVGVEPALIELVYSPARDGKPASVDASVTGWWTRFGERDQFGGRMATHFKDGPDGWPAWLAEEARLHDPAAIPVPAPAPTDGSVREQLLDALDFAYCQGLGYGTPEELVAAYDATLLPPTDQTALRDRIAEAIDGVFTRWQTGLGDQRPQDAIHDAVMAVLPTPTDRAALVDLVDQLIEHCPDHGCVEPEWGDGCHCEIVPLLRRLADAVPVSGPGGAADETRAARPRCPHCQMPHDLTPDIAAVCASIRASIAAHETQQPETRKPCRCPHPANEHSVYGCADDCACEWMPRRKPAAVTDQPLVVHAIPEPGSNGISACCNRAPCEFVGERVTREPNEVTCPGPAAVAQPDGEA
jgi:hypothetical protein